MGVLIQDLSCMFSFFAVPILLGDITIDFMQMVDVMVDVMVMVTGEEGEDGDGNNNAKKRRKRGKRQNNGYMRQDVIDSLLDTFENEPSNLTMIKHYESLAKKHIIKYLDAFNAKEKKPFKISNTVNDIIGPRHSVDVSYSIYPNQNKKVVFESLALQFVGRLQDSFLNFKNYCASIDNVEEDCAILDTDWSNVLEDIK